MFTDVLPYDLLVTLELSFGQKFPRGRVRYYFIFTLVTELERISIGDRPESPRWRLVHLH